MFIVAYQECLHVHDQRVILYRCVLNKQVVTRKTCYPPQNMFVSAYQECLHVHDQRVVLCRCVLNTQIVSRKTTSYGYSGVSPGVGIKHLEGPKNPDGLTLGIYVFVYVCKVHICMYMLKGRMRSLTQCLFSSTFVFFSTKKSKRCQRKPPIISNLRYKI